MKKIVVKSKKESKVEKENKASEKHEKGTKNKSKNKVKEICLSSEHFKLERVNNKVRTKESKKYQVQFIDRLTQDELLVLEKDYHTLKLCFQGTKGKVDGKSVVRDNVITYKDVEHGLDLEYICCNRGIKESLIIKERRENYDFKFNLNVGDLLPKFNEKYNTLELLKEGRVIYRILSPYMEDMKGERSEECSYQIVEEQGKLMLILHADSNWINKKERLFPITIDPTIEVLNNEIFEITQLINGTQSTISDDKLTVGYSLQDNIQYNTIVFSIDIPRIKQEVDDMSRVYIELKTKSNSLDIEDKIKLILDDEILSMYNIRDIKDVLKIDITSLINIHNEPIDLYLCHIDEQNDESEESEIGSSGLTINKFIEFYSPYYENEKLKSKLIIERNDQSFKNDSVNIYDLGRAGKTIVNIKNGNYKHEHEDGVTIKNNSLSISLSHIFDSDSFDTNSSFFGNGWRSNLHQRLIKSSEYNDLLSAKEIFYIDGFKEKHEFKEQWYYKKDNIKHYINRDLVFLDADKKLKVYVDNQLYEASFTYTNEEDQMTLISASNINGYNSYDDLKKEEKLYVSIGDGHKIYINIVKGYVNVPIFVIISDEVEYLSYDNVVFEDGNYRCKFNNEVAEVSYVDAKVNFDEKCIYFINNTSNEIREEKIYIKKEITYENISNKKQEDIYQNEDIRNINAQIKQLEKSLKSYVQQLDLMFLNFEYRTYSDQKKLEYKLEELKSKVLEARDAITNSMSGDSKTRQRNYDIASDNLSAAQESMEESLAEYKESIDIDSYNNNLETIEHLLDDLKVLRIKRDELILEQKKAVNDLIIDKDGNTLGFDGYGRLVLIQDKYENDVKIEYGYEEENEGKIIYITTENQSIVFNYDKDSGQLSSLLDPRGKRILYKYDDNNNLISIIYSDEKETHFDYDEHFLVRSPLLETNEITTETDGKMVIKHYCYDGTISSNTAKLENTNPLILADEYSYTFNIEENATSIKNEKTGSKNNYFFNELGKIIRQEDEETTIISFYESKKLIYEARHKNYNKEAEGINYPLLRVLTTQTSQINLRTLDKLPTSNLLAVKISLASGTIDYELIDSFKIKASVHDENSDEVEVFEHSYQELKNQVIILPICINHKSSSQIDIEIISDYDVFNEAYIDEIELVALEGGKILKYDNQDRLIEKRDGSSTISYLDYNDDDIPLRKEERTIYGEEITTRYSYDSKNQLTCIEDSKNNVEEYYYDDKGNCVEKRTYNKKDASLMKIEKVTYDEQGRQSSSLGPIKNEFGEYPKEEITYLSGNNIISKVKGVNGSTRCYQYDNNTGELLMVASQDKGINNSTSFTYNYGLLTSMKHHGVSVEYEYDGRGRKTSVSLNGQQYVMFGYQDNYSNPEFDITHGSRQTQAYKDGLYQEVKIDEHNLVKEIQRIYTEEDIVNKTIHRYEYDSDQNVSSIVSKDIEINEEDEEVVGRVETLNYTYDDYGNITDMTKEIGSNMELYKTYTYDERQRTIKEEISIQDGEVEVIEYSYEEDNISLIDYDNTYYCSLQYDVLNRTTHNDISLDNVNICHEYSYLQQDENTLDLITEDITKIKIINNNETTYLTETSTYEYDVNGNIIRIINDDNETRYQYDKLNRLIREDNPLLNKTIIYKYDKAGNILLKKAYEYTLEEKLYSPLVKEYIYDCENRDQLISYDGKSISYDEMGRPIIYKDDEYEWNKQGQLVYIVNQDLDEIEYLYDHNGTRRKKIVNGVETTYITNDTQIMGIKEGNKRMIFRYVLNKLIGFSYNDGSRTKEYLYQRNIQGDIIGIYDSEGSQVGGYSYDAYGNHVITINIDNIAVINPFRYRGYFFDEETGLFLVSSRYYDPETGRFISPDDISYLEPETIGGLNLYAYCLNNPVMYVDPTGHSWESFWNGVGNWFKDNWVKLAIGAAFIVAGAVVTFFTAGMGTAGLLAAGSALLASAKAVGISMAVSAGIGAVVGGITGGWEGALQGFSNGLADGFMWGGIFAGSAQILGGASKLLASRNVDFSDKFNWLFGNRNSQSTTLLRVNKAGKQLFRIDADITHLWHLHYGATSALMRIHRTGIALFSYLGIANGLKGLFGGF